MNHSPATFGAREYTILSYPQSVLFSLSNKMKCFDEEKCWKVVMKNRQKAVGLRHVERMYQHSFLRATLLRGQNENMCIIILAKLFN